MSYRILLAVVLALFVASCGRSPDLAVRPSADREPDQSKGDAPRAPLLALPASLTLSKKVPDMVSIVAPIRDGNVADLNSAHEPVDEKEENWCVRKDRYANVEYHWGKWKLLEVQDSERRYSHVRIEFDGVLQFLSTGSSGYALAFFDSDDFAGSHFEDDVPPANDDTPVWLNEFGKRTNLVVEDLTGSQGATLLLQESTGGNHVFRITTFIHLTPGGDIATHGPFGTSMEATHSVRSNEDVVFDMNDNCWQGWGCCEAASAHPVVRVSLKGGIAHSCNGPLSTSEVAAIEQAVIDDPDHADILFRMGVLDLVYHGQIDDARRLVRETPLMSDFPERAAWWSDLIRNLRTSTFYNLLEKEFPQLKEADELK